MFGVVCLCVCRGRPFLWASSGMGLVWECVWWVCIVGAIEGARVCVGMSVL